jgi:hypothetical protein
LPNAWAFSGAYAVETDLHLTVLAVEAGERVAVGDRDDLELLGQRGASQGQEEESSGGEETWGDRSGVPKESGRQVELVSRCRVPIEVRKTATYPDQITVGHRSSSTSEELSPPTPKMNVMLRLARRTLAKH